MEIKESDKIWLAGFFEAEGHCGKTSLELTQNDPAPLLWAQKIYGGKFTKRVVKSPASDKICTGHGLRFRKEETRKFIDDILPYLQVPRKIEQIKQNWVINTNIIKKVLSHDEKCAYYAGFWEGDGYISNDIAFNNSLVLGMDQQTEEPFPTAKETWGGFIRKRTRKSPASDKVCITYCWTIRGKDKGLNFCKDIDPYLRIPYKINQIKTAIDKCGQKTNTVYKCDECDKVFANPANKRRHKVEYHIKKEKFICDDCGNEYKNYQSLVYHKKSIHSERKYDKCELCDITFKDLRGLENHNKRAHSTT